MGSARAETGPLTGGDALIVYTRLRVADPDAVVLDSVPSLLAEEIT